MVKRSEPWESRSALSRFAHVFERAGLALAGGSCGLFVAAYVAKANISLMGSEAAILGSMIYGAAGFYLGIDLPQAPEHIHELPLRRLGSHADAVELFSAAGTFLAAVTAAISVWNIILDNIAGTATAAAFSLAWAIGASMQIAAGVIARLRARASATS